MNMVDFFSGIGGGTLGFLYAEYPCAYACDSDDKARYCYVNNFLLSLTHDIRLVQVADVRHPEVVFASPPSDPALFSHAMKLIGEMKPRAVLLEFGIRRLKKEGYDAITKAFEAIGYNSWHEALNSNDYGLAHRRRNIYFVAFRKDVSFLFTYFPFPEPTNKTATLAGILDPNAPDTLLLTAKRIESIRKENDSNKAAGTGFGHKIYQPSEVVASLPLQYYKDYRNVLVDAGKGPRRLSVFECKRLMGFPPEFRLPVCDTEAYRLIAQASCPPVIEAIAGEIDDWIKY